MLVLLLPGAAYACQMPLLYCPARLLLALGADVLWIESHYSQQMDFRALSQAEWERPLYSEGSGACRSVLTQRRYEQVTLIGKSIGTLTMAHSLTADAAPAHAQAIRLTPFAVARENKGANPALGRTFPLRDWYC